MAAIARRDSTTDTAGPGVQWEHGKEVNMTSFARDTATHAVEAAQVLGPAVQTEKGEAVAARDADMAVLRPAADTAGRSAREWVPRTMPTLARPPAL